MVTKPNDKELCTKCMVKAMGWELCDRCETERDGVEVKKFYTPIEEDLAHERRNL